MRTIRLFSFFFLLIMAVSAGNLAALSDKIKYDPFIPLVDLTGRIRQESELVRPVEVPLNIILKGIIWSKADPLAIINSKIYREGAVISENITLEKIEPNSITLNNQGEKIKIELRKKEKR